MLGRFGRLGNEVESFRLKGETDSSRRTATLSVIYGNGEVVANARIELWYKDALISVVYTDDKGIAKIRVSTDYVYTLRVLGSNFQTVEIEDYDVTDIEIIVTENPYLDIYPTFIHLMKGNNYKENVNIRSNVEWVLT